MLVKLQIGFSLAKRVIEALKPPFFLSIIRCLLNIWSNTASNFTRCRKIKYGSCS